MKLVDFILRCKRIGKAMYLWLEQPEGRFVLYMWVLTVKVYKHPLLLPVSRVLEFLTVSPLSPSPSQRHC